MRLPLAALVGLLAVAAHAQPSPNVGPYGVFGNASPERLLFPAGTDPSFSAGWRLSRHLDVHVGYRGRGREALGPDRATRRQEPAEFIERTRQRAGTASVGVAVPLGRVRTEVRTSLAYEAYRRTRESLLFLGEPAGVEVEQATGRFVHAGVSALVAVPIGTERGGVTPGVGLAVSRSADVGGTLDAQRGRWMPFVRVPIAVRVADRATVSLEVTGGAVRYRPLADRAVSRWGQAFDISARVSF